MEEERFVTEYNKLINRIKKAEKFLESDTYIGKDKKAHKYQNLEEEIRYKERWIPEYQKLVKETGIMAAKYKELTGYRIPTDELMNGFCK